MGTGASRDVTSDADATSDAGTDAGTDATSDVTPDAGADVTQDVTPDAGTGAVPDAASDATPGAASGAVPDDNQAAPAAGSPADADGPAEASEGVTAAGSSPGPEGEASPESGRDVEADFSEPQSKGVVSVPSPEGPVRSTRRFPLFTRDTARPEGGGRAAPGGAAAPVRQWPFLAVMGVTAFGLLLVAVDAFGIGFRLGTLLIGLSLIGGAVMRRLIPSVGMLAVRSRFTDMVTYGLLGVVISLLALMAQPAPWLEIPFLEAVVRFTVR
ncbi:DUF3017 domain-containing protein [Streptomyces sp. A5-4]|uniref:DUF3017 domain-containing protein n=1 Tax=Streptomyces sp. A5-4 TaxID=3384771 RepID=UPI003DA84CE4